MPIYKYNCSNCGNKEPKLIPASQRDATLKCNKCEEPSLVREVAKETPQHNVLRSANPDRFEATKQRLRAEEIMYDFPADARETHQEHIDKLKEMELESATLTDQEDAHAMKNGMDITK